MHKAVFLDRDGVISEDIDGTSKIEDIRIIDKVPEAIKNLKEKGFKLFVITNQPIVSRGIITEQELQAIHNEMKSIIKDKTKAEIDDFFYCPHHPNSTIKQYGVVCNCRKPSPGMILNAAKKHNINLQESWVIGDQIVDIAAGKSAGCKTIMVASPKNNYMPIINGTINKDIKPDNYAKNLLDATRFIK